MIITFLPMHNTEVPEPQINNDNTTLKFIFASHKLEPECLLIIPYAF